MRAFPVIRDLVTDVSFNYEKAARDPGLHAAGRRDAAGEYRMQQVDVERSQEFRKCIECFLCQDTCHVIRDHEENKAAFAGPRFLIRIAELDMHPLDALDRQNAAQEELRPGLLQHHQVLHRGLPRGHPHHRQRLIPMKERVVDRKYDPLTFLGSQDPAPSPGLIRDTFGTIFCSSTGGRT